MLKETKDKDGIRQLRCMGCGEILYDRQEDKGVRPEAVTTRIADHLSRQHQMFTTVILDHKRNES